MLEGYIFPTKKLNNDIHEINDDVIETLLAQNEYDRIRCSEITANTFSNEFKPKTRHDWMIDIMLDAQREGFRMHYPYGTVIRQAERPHYYRGETQIHAKSIPSLHRSIAAKSLNSETEQQLYKLIADMRIRQFGAFLFEFRHVQYWQINYGDVLIEQIAQHYGFETRWLDITNDFLVAMFFATCFYDSGRWKPLTDEHMKINPYGMIFHIPAWSANLTQMVEAFPNNAPNNAVWSIGFQPFMRCHMQHGYSIYMEKEFPLQKDVQFEKLKFKHSTRLSKMIFDMTKEGKMIFPHEGLDALSDVIAQIRNTSIFSEEDFEYAFNKNTYFTNKTRCRELLLKSNVSGRKIEIIKTQPIKLTRNQINLIDETYKDFDMEKKYKIQIGTRSVYYPTSE